MRANNSGKKVDLTSVLQDVDDEVREVHASVSESAIRDQQINMMMLSRMHQVCAEEPAKAAFKYNLPTDVVELIAESGPDFYMKIQPLADKFMFDLQPTLGVFGAEAHLIENAVHLAFGHFRFR